MKKKKKAFTLIELLVVIAIIALLVSILIPSVGKIRELAKRALCGANMKALGNALAQYRGENNDYPWLANGSSTQRMVFASAMHATAATVYGLLSSQSGATDLNLLDNLNLLVSTNQAPYKAFLCPSAGTNLMKRGGTNSNYGWIDADTTQNYGRPCIDYAYHIGYSWISTGDASTNPATLNDQLDGSVVIMADAPVKLSDTKVNTCELPPAGQNNTDGYAHKTDGVQVLYASGGASFSEKSVRAGWGRNNIYIQDVQYTIGNNGVETPTVTSTASSGGNSITYVPVTSSPASSRYDSVLYWGK